MNIFQTFLRATKQGSYRPDAIYVGAGQLHYMAQGSQVEQ